MTGRPSELLVLLLMMFGHDAGRGLYRILFGRRRFGGAILTRFAKYPFAWFVCVLRFGGVLELARARLTYLGDNALIT